MCCLRGPFILAGSLTGHALSSGVLVKCTVQRYSAGDDPPEMLLNDKTRTRRRRRRVVNAAVVARVRDCVLDCGRCSGSVISSTPAAEAAI